ncbi:unnamed protein product, partial [Symbiodinium sp. KB8]
MASNNEVVGQMVGCNSGEQLQENAAVTLTAGALASMETVDPSILRATQAWRVLYAGGSAVRLPNRHLFHHSFPASSIQVFWSHSWHGNKLLKTLLLLMLYNGPAATIAANISALLMMILQSASFLPGYERRGSVDRTVEFVLGPWCTLTGGLVFTLFLLTWKSNRVIFYDQICIHQTDPHLKREGILSIGAFLKHSDEFLLVWDDSYAGRLWCMLELAGYMKSHALKDLKVHVRIVAMAPCILGVGFALWASMFQWLLVFDLSAVAAFVLLIFRWFFMYIAAAYLRSHYRNTEVMLGQLSDFTVRSAGCHCCSKAETACRKVICDRAVIAQCIRTWYGSVEAFEGTVKTQVKTMLYRQLGGLLIPYGWQVVGASPLLWGFADITAARLRAGTWEVAAITFLGGLTWCLCMFPFIFQSSLLLAKYFRKKAPTIWQDRLKSIGVASILTFLSFIATWTSLFVDVLLPAVIWLCAVVLLSGCCWFAIRHLAKRMEKTQAQSKRGAKAKKEELQARYQDIRVLKRHVDELNELFQRSQNEAIGQETAPTTLGKSLGLRDLGRASEEDTKRNLTSQEEDALAAMKRRDEDIEKQIEELGQAVGRLDPLARQIGQTAERHRLRAEALGAEVDKTEGDIQQLNRRVNEVMRYEKNTHCCCQL